MGRLVAIEEQQVIMRSFDPSLIMPLRPSYSKSTPRLSSVWPDGVRFPLSELAATGGSEHPS
jgi:hypothetical protein